MTTLLLVISVFALAMSIPVAVAEMRAERDWPRDTGCYPIIFACTTTLLFFAI